MQHWPTHDNVPHALSSPANGGGTANRLMRRSRPRAWLQTNKLAAFLGACLVQLFIHTVDAAPAQVPIERLLPSASIERGAQIAKQCEVCHNLGKGQGIKVGPDLYGIVGQPVAAKRKFHYSPALKAKGGTWNFDALNTWLTNPSTDVPGTLMTFAGISNEQERADVIAYLNSNSDHPLPLSKATGDRPGG